jgi:ferrous iron transport protein A
MSELLVMEGATEPTTLAPDARTLDQLKPGDQATITNIKSSHLTIKLLEMGLLPGKEVRFNFAAPLGDPIAVQVNGYTLSLRLDEACLIELA